MRSSAHGRNGARAAASSRTTQLCVSTADSLRRQRGAVSLRATGARKANRYTEPIRAARALRHHTSRLTSGQPSSIRASTQERSAIERANEDAPSRST